MTYKEANAAFEAAIKSERLSDNENRDNYAGHYMYMGTDSSGKDCFKNRVTRQYVA